MFSNSPGFLVLSPLNNLDFDVQNLDKHKGSSGTNLVCGFVSQSNPVEVLKPFFMVHGLSGPLYFLNFSTNGIPDWVETFELLWSGFMFPLPPPLAVNVVGSGPPADVQIGFEFNLPSFDFSIPEFNLGPITWPSISLPGITLPELGALDWKLALPAEIQAKLKAIELWFANLAESFLEILSKMYEIFGEIKRRLTEAITDFLLNCFKFITSFKFEGKLEGINFFGLIELFQNWLKIPIEWFNSFYNWIKTKIPTIDFSVNIDFSQIINEWFSTIHIHTPGIDLQSLNNWFSSIGKSVEDGIQYLKDLLEKFIQLILSIYGKAVDKINEICEAVSKAIQSGVNAFVEWLKSLIPKLPEFTPPNIQFSIPGFTLPTLSGFKIPIASIAWDNWLKPNGTAIVPNYFIFPDTQVAAAVAAGYDPLTPLPEAAIPTHPPIPNLVSVFSYPGMIYYGVVKIKAKPGLSPGVKDPIDLFVTASPFSFSSGINKQKVGRLSCSLSVLTDEQYQTAKSGSDKNAGVPGSTVVWFFEKKTGTNLYKVAPGLKPSTIEYLKFPADKSTIKSVVSKPNSLEDDFILDEIKSELEESKIKSIEIFKETVSNTGVKSVVNYTTEKFTNDIDLMNYVKPTYWNISFEPKNLTVPQINTPTVSLPSGLSLGVKVGSFSSSGENNVVKNTKIKISWLNSFAKPAANSNYSAKVNYTGHEYLNESEKSKLKFVKQGNDYYLDISDISVDIPNSKIEFSYKTDSEPLIPE